MVNCFDHHLHRVGWKRVSTPTAYRRRRARSVLSQIRITRNTINRVSTAIFIVRPSARGRVSQSLKCVHGYCCDQTLDNAIPLSEDHTPAGGRTKPTTTQINFVHEATKVVERSGPSAKKDDLSIVSLESLHFAIPV